MVKAIYPGSFDPITNGHLDIIKRAVRIFRNLVVAVVNNPNKKALFTVEQRVEMIEAVLQNMPTVEADSFHGLLVDYASKQKADVILRGLRAVSDFEYEFQMAMVNRMLHPDLEIMYLMPDKEYFFLSSRLVKEVAALGGDITEMVPDVVRKKLLERFNKK